MKVAIITHFGGEYEALADIVVPILERYCKKHHYSLFVNKVGNGKYDFVRTKDARRLLDIYDLVFAPEIDLMITNLTIPIGAFIDDKHSFFICKDVNGINGGSFIVKNTNYGKMFLDNTNNPIYGFKTEQNYWEVNAEDHPDVCILYHPSINSIPYKHYHNYGYIKYEGQLEPAHEEGNWKPGDFIVHTPGLEFNKRVEILSNLKSQIVYE